MAAPSSLAKLTSLSTQTLSLLLERQRLQTLPSYSSSPASGSSSNLHVKQITRNLSMLRSGILEFERSLETGLDNEATALLREQYDRMKNMLGDVDGVHIESLAPKRVSPPPPPSPPLVYPPRPSDSEWRPYSDDPQADLEAQNSDDFDPDDAMQMQQQLMAEQDTHLQHLSNSISRQHTLSLQIGDELDVHSGLLDGLDSDLDRTDTRLSGARKKLDRVRRGLEGNVSSVAIGVMILLLLILIVVFKT